MRHSYITFPGSLQACVSVERAYWYKEWRRLVLSPLHHADDFHLYFNMVSFLWKGIRLERRMGGAWFCYLLSVFSLLTGVVYLLLEMALTELTQEITYSMQCAVGFSGNSVKHLRCNHCVCVLSVQLLLSTVTSVAHDLC